MTEVSNSQTTADPEGDAALRTREAHEIYKGIGRNVVLLQQMEQMLRHLVTSADVAGPTSDLTAQRKVVAKIWKRASLDKLDEEFRSRVLSDEEKPASEAFAVRVRFPTSAEEREKRGKQLRRVVKERNKLVHRLPFDWFPGRAEGYRELSAWLDQMWRENLPLWTEMKRQVSMLRTLGRFVEDQEDSDFQFMRTPGEEKR